MKNAEICKSFRGIESKDLHIFAFLSDTDGLSGTDAAAFYAVQPSKLVDTDTIFSSNSSQGISIFDAVVNGFPCGGSCRILDFYRTAAGLIYFGLVIVDTVFVFNKTTDHVIGQTKRIGFLVAGNNIFLEFRIQCPKLVDIDVADTGNLIEIQIAGYMDRICSFRHVHIHRADVMLTIVSHDIVCSNEGRYVSSGFFRQVIVNSPEVGSSSGAADSLVDGSGTAIVCCQHKIPVMIDFVQVLQVTDSSPG